jgi:hypothetical protein
LPFFNFGKVSVGALQLFAPLPAVIVVGALRQLGALFGLSSQEFHGSHFSDSRIPGFRIAPFLILHCNQNYTASQQVLSTRRRQFAEGPRSMSMRLSRSRQTPGIFSVNIWLQGDAASIANFPCSSVLMSAK